MKNNRCFIIGLGSSINKQDLKLLKNEDVIGMSSLHKHPDIDIINPKYYLITRIIQHLKYYTEKDLLSLLTDIDKTLSNKTIICADINDKDFFYKHSIFNKKEIIWISYSNVEFSIKERKFLDFCFVSESAIQLSLYLNYESIYLVGFDHDWFNGAIQYFDTKKVRKNFKKVDSNFIKNHSFDSQYLMEQYTKTFNQYKLFYSLKENIYNVNSNKKTYVDTFPKMDYNKLLKRTDEKKLQKKAKNKFIKTPYKNMTLEFSNKLRNLYLQIESLPSNNTYIIYGAGSIGKIISKLLKTDSYYFIDKTSNNMDRIISKGEIYSVSNLNNISYDYIIISVLSYEKEIISYLKAQFDIDDDIIITF